MSLFTARCWWSTKLTGSDDKFSEGGLVVGNVDNASDGTAKLVTGSLSGTVRVHNPALHKSDGSEELTTLLESNLDAPVLELKLGRLVASDDNGSLALAVLHPRKVAVYTVETSRLRGDDSCAAAQHHELVLQYFHKLGTNGQHFTAHSMCVAPFGCRATVTQRDMLMVQSLDCRITVYEQDAEAFTRRLTDCLIPGPLVYVPSTDSIVTTTLNLEVRSFRYDVLVASSDEQNVAAKQQDESEGRLQGITTRRVVVADWSVDVGDMVLHLNVATASKKAILAVGERGFYVLSTSGSLLAQRLLEFEAVSPCVYDRARLGNGGSPEPLALLGTTDGRLVVLSIDSCRTLWVARSAYNDAMPPLAVEVCDLPDKPGMIAVLDEASRLSLFYLGTEPSLELNNAKPSSDRVAYSTLFDEMRQLKAKLASIECGDNRTYRRRSASSGRVALQAQAPMALDDDGDDKVDPELAIELDLVRQPPLSEYDGDGVTQQHLGPLVSATAKFYVSWAGRASIDGKLEVSTTVAAPNWTYCETVATRQVLVVSDPPSTPQIERTIFFARRDRPPASMNVTATTSYIAPGSLPRCVSTEFRLPLCMACRVLHPPVRDANFKLTLDTDREAAPLGTLFASEAVGLSSSAVSFEFWYESEPTKRATATVLVSKKKGSYRVQATSISAMWLIAEELVYRLRKFFGDRCVISYNDDLPLSDAYAAVDAHHAARQSLREAEALLNDAAHEFRVVEKRMLVRFKDSRPIPLNKLDVLLCDGHNRVLVLASAVQRAQNERDHTGRLLEASINLLLLLLELRFSLTPPEARLLKHHFNPDVAAFNKTGTDDPQAGWEELTDASLTFLLRTTLSSKHTQDAVANHHQPAFPKNTDKLKRHIAMVCDRLDRGNRPQFQYDDDDAKAPAVTSEGKSCVEKLP